MSRDNVLWLAGGVWLLTLLGTFLFSQMWPILLISTSIVCLVAAVLIFGAYGAVERRERFDKLFIAFLVLLLSFPLIFGTSGARIYDPGLFWLRLIIGILVISTQVVGFLSMRRRLPGRREIARLLAEVHHPDKHIREQAIWALGETQNPQVVEPLLTALEDPDEDIRGDALIALGEIGDARALSPLLHALQDSDPAVRDCAVGGLSKIGDPVAVPSLIAALDDSDSSVRVSAAWALGGLRDRQAVPTLIPALISALDDPEWLVRCDAIGALGAFGDEQVLTSLQRVTQQDAHSSVRRDARVAIKDIQKRRRQ